jgi:hypothetical protein
LQCACVRACVRARVRARARVVFCTVTGPCGTRVCRVFKFSSCVRVQVRQPEGGMRW